MFQGRKYYPELMLELLIRAGASVKHECGAAMRMEVAGDRLEESITYTCEWNGTWTPGPGNPTPKCKCEIEIIKVNMKL